MSQLFGFRINEGEKYRGQSPVAPNQEDAVATVAGGYFGTYVDTDGGNKSNEYQLIQRYRSMALHPECDSAIDEIVNEFVVSDSDDSPVEINLDNLDLGINTKNKIRKEFDNVLKMLSFDKNCHQIIRNWYIDGKTYYHKVIDLDNPKQGILELRYIDPLKMKKVRHRLDKDTDKKIKERGSALEYDWGDYIEYYIYNPKGFATSGVPATSGQMDYSNHQGIKMAADSIASTESGLKDTNKRITISFLHKAIKSLNQLRMIEDSLVIYRLSRAPERRIFYIDVGNLPKVKAEQYLRDVMAQYRNKMVFDSSTGEVRDDKKHMSMLEDFWLPRREGGRGTEITTLPGGQNLGELKDVEYFKKKLYNSLNLPPSRLTDDNKGFNLGKTTEVLRDELKFSKFIGRLRKRFSGLFHDVLKTQLILKGVIAPEDWEDMEEHIQYDYLFDNHFNELKELEMMKERLAVVTELDPFLGKYVSSEYIRKKVLLQTEKEYKEIDKQIKKDLKAGIALNPAEVNQLDMMDRENAALAPELEAEKAEEDNERALEMEREKAKLAPKTPKAPSSNK